MAEETMVFQDSTEVNMNQTSWLKSNNQMGGYTAGMEATNNHAEQALRLPVIFRKTSFGSRSLSGAQNLATNLSLIGTAKRQGKDPMEPIKNLLLDGKNTSPETLYEIENFRTFDTS